MSKLTKEILDIAKTLSYLKQANSDEEYLTPKGQGLLEGLAIANQKVKVVSLDQYAELEVKYEELEKKFNSLKQKLNKNKKPFW